MRRGLFACLRRPLGQCLRHESQRRALRRPARQRLHGCIPRGPDGRGPGRRAGMEHGVGTAGRKGEGGRRAAGRRQPRGHRARSQVQGAAAGGVRRAR